MLETSPKAPKYSPDELSPGSAGMSKIQPERAPGPSPESRDIFRSKSSIRRSLSIAKEKIRVEGYPLDHLAVEPRPPSRLGCALSICVFISTAIYIGFLVLQYMLSPSTTTNGLVPSIRGGPYETEISCHARSGCILINDVTPEFTDGAAARANDILPIQKCINMPYKSNLSVPLVYSVNPREALSVIWDAASTDEGMHAGYGLLMAHMTRCAEFYLEKCELRVPSQIGPGRGGIFHAVIVNMTSEGKGAIRREFIPHMESSDGRIDPGAAPCAPSADWKEAVQTSLRFDFFYYTDIWFDENFWLYLWGSAGGAFGSFMEVALSILFVSGIIMHFRSHKKEASESRQVQDSFKRFEPEMKISLRRPSSRQSLHESPV